MKALPKFITAASVRLGVLVTWGEIIKWSRIWNSRRGW